MSFMPLLILNLLKINFIIFYLLMTVLIFLAATLVSNYLLDNFFKIERMIAAGTDVPVLDEKDLLHNLLDNLSIGIVVYNANGTVSFVNQAMEEMLYYPKQMWIGKSIEHIYNKILSPEDRVKSPVLDVIKGNLKVVKKKTNYIAQNGEIVPALIDIHAFLNAEGLSMGALVLVTDLRKELKMEKLENVFSYIFDSLSVGAIIIDNEQKISHFNQYAEIITGSRKEEVVRKNLLQFFRYSSLQVLFELLLQGKNEEFFNYDFQCTLGGKEKKLLVDSYQIFDNQGEKIGTAILLKDISDLQAVQAKMHNLEQQAQFILESIDVGVVAVNNELMITAYNKAAENTLGIPRSKAINQNINLVFPIEAGEHYFIQETALRGKEFNEIHINKTLGESGELIISTQCLYDKEGNPLGAVSVFKDITQLRKIENEMQRTERLSIIGELAAGIAHEVKNPLCVIKGLLEIMLEEEAESLDLEDLQIIRKETERVEKIIQEYLQLARPSEPIFTETDPNQIITDVHALMKSFAKFNAVEIVTHLQSGLPKVYADMSQLKQVLINIVKNGIEAMNGSGKLEIKTRLSGEQEIEILVKDTGCGISKEILKNLGTPFLTTKQGGTGLGLMVSYKIIEKHGGRVRVGSEPGQGTEFIIILPVHRIISQHYI